MYNGQLEGRDDLSVPGLRDGPTMAGDGSMKGRRWQHDVGRSAWARRGPGVSAAAYFWKARAITRREPAAGSWFSCHQLRWFANQCCSCAPSVVEVLYLLWQGALAVGFCHAGWQGSVDWLGLYHNRPRPPPYRLGQS